MHFKIVGPFSIDKMSPKEHHGTIFNFGNIKFYLLDTLVFEDYKNVLEKYIIQVHGSWEPYLSSLD